MNYHPQTSQVTQKQAISKPQSAVEAKFIATCLHSRSQLTCLEAMTHFMHSIVPGLFLKVAYSDRLTWTCICVFLTTFFESLELTVQINFYPGIE